MKVAVVGAGPGGVTTLYTIKRRLLPQYPDLTVVCYETDRDIGGQWIFNEDTGRTVAESVPVNGATYEGLRMNSPKVINQLHPDFPYPEEVNEFPTREQNLQYIRSFADKFNLRKWIKFNSFVKNIDWKENKFSVTVLDMEKQLETIETFDYVFMCAG